MKVFESLNCIVCKEPFARVANQPRSPRHLCCGLAMCHECFEKEQMLAQNERKHQCVPCYPSTSPNFAYFLIDVLSQENALMLTPMGYVLVKPFKIPECPICQDECQETTYSSYCEIKCPTCNRFSPAKYTDVNKQKDRFHGFLNELPEMTRQMEAMTKAHAFIIAGEKQHATRNVKDECSCNECHEENIIDKMFYCSACSFEICAVCAYKKHRLHEAIPLFEKQANQMLMELQEESRNVIKTYKDLVPELHKGLLEGIDIFETKLLSKEEILKDTSTFADYRKKHESFAKIKSTFESYAEDYLPCLRKFDTGVNQLIQTLNETADV
ncbi:unnamed protein product, partial [Mesorhabditis belari]|uniref:B box-type domain-containing protein n=1 Tax=Mesorhabditis belari TaxID=2138241 RepID=A0AAF3ERG1_9BILA